MKLITNMTKRKRLDLLLEELKKESGMDNLWIDESYSGYDLVRVNKDNGSNSNPFRLGHARYTIKEITAIIEALIVGIEFQKNKNDLLSTKPSKLVCCKCGSGNVLVQVWVDPNTSIIDDIDDFDKAMCLNCEANVELEPKE